MALDVFHQVLVRLHELAGGNPALLERMLRILHDSGVLTAEEIPTDDPFISEERWKAIMRTRALDNQFVVAVARNEGIGSTIINPRGDIIAWNDGTEDIIAAEAVMND